VSGPAGVAALQPRRSLRGWIDRFLIESNGAIFIALVGLIAFFTIASPNQAFISPFAVRSMILAGSSILIVAVGATFVLIAGQIDLSVGSSIVLSGVVGIESMTRLIAQGFPEVGAIAIGCGVVLLVGSSVGLVNGLIVTRLRIPSFIVTLGTLGIALGIAQLVSVGPLSQQVPRSMSEAIGRGSLVGIPWAVVVAAAITAFAWVVLSQTRVGLACYAVGSNREAARRAGVPVNRLIVTVFVAMGLCAGTAAILDMARFTTVSVAGYTNTALAAISAVIIGGTSLFGGRGTITGTVVGVMIPVVLLSGLVILGVDPFWQNIVIGAMLILAVGFDQYQRDRIARGLDSGGPAPEPAAAAEPSPSPRLPGTDPPTDGEPPRSA
jgi:ribose transport system permease protein